MKTLADFQASLTLPEPGRALSAQLKGLWYDAKGDWHRAHAQVDQLADQASARVHAYLHRREGDLGNAGYWYRRAGQGIPAISLDEEREQLVLHFINAEPC